MYGVRCMDIGFIWDEDKYQEVQRKHRVQFYEVVAAWDDPHGYETPDPQGHEDRWMWIGKTPSGRILSVICSDEDAPLQRLITAFDAGQRYIDEYYKRN